MRGKGKQTEMFLEKIKIRFKKIENGKNDKQHLATNT